LRGKFIPLDTNDAVGYDIMVPNKAHLAGVILVDWDLMYNTPYFSEVVSVLAENFGGRPYFEIDNIKNVCDYWVSQHGAYK